MWTIPARLAWHSLVLVCISLGVAGAVLPLLLALLGGLFIGVALFLLSRPTLASR